MLIGHLDFTNNSNNMNAPI